MFITTHRGTYINMKYVVKMYVNCRAGGFTVNAITINDDDVEITSAFRTREDAEAKMRQILGKKILDV